MGLARDAVGQGCDHGEPLEKGDGTSAERSEASGYLVGHHPEGHRVAMVSVRAAVIDSEPERVKTAAPLPLSGSHASAVGKQPELVAVSDRRVKIAKHFQPLR